MATTDLHQEVVDRTHEFRDCLNSMDLDRAATLYEEDAYFMPPAAPLAKGVAEIKERQQILMKRGIQHVELDCHKMLDLGDVAIEIGHMEITLQPEGMPEPIQSTGKSIVMWRRQDDGSLKLVADILSSDDM